MNILIINDSPAGNFGITLRTILSIKEPSIEPDYEILNFGQRFKAIEKSFSSVEEKLEKADVIVFCCPVYTPRMLSRLWCFIELIKERNVSLAGKTVTYVSGSDRLYDTAAREFIQENCPELGLKYVRGLSMDKRDLLKKRGWRKTQNFFRHVFRAVKDKDIPDTYQTPSQSVSDPDPSKPMIALTFDDGPGYNSASDRILDLLSEYHARATFFMIGENAKAHPDNVMRKWMLGHEIGSHTWDHRHIGDEITREDIEKGAKAIEEITGAATSAFRSPCGSTRPLIRDVCKELGVPLYYWTVDTNDWKYRNARKVYKAVVDHVKDGDIVLMHEIYPSTARAVEKILPVLAARGYQFVTCRELVLAKTGSEPVPGIQYISPYIIRNDTD